MKKENQKQETVIKLGKVHYVVKEKFAETGKEIDELLEQLAVKKLSKTA